MAKFNRKVCGRCKCVFVPEFHEQNECYRCLVEAKERKDKDAYQEMRAKCFGAKIETVECVICGKEFKRAVRLPRKTCSDFCFSQLPKRKKVKKKNDPIAEANEKWLAGKERKAGRKLPLDVLNKMAEHKRVFDDHGWDHYLKGRKWDRI